MRLADFIEQNVCLIADGAQAFAATQTPQGVHLDETALRDHIPEILLAVVADLRTKQSAEAQLLKSEGRASVLDGPRTPASTHGMLRAKGGFDINQMVAEYRALRAAVLRLWIDAHEPSKQSFDDMIRFNEAIDQAISESVSYFSKEAESWRQVFLGVLGHDLRAPLSVIVTTSDLLSRMTRDGPYSEHTQRIVRSGMRMSKLLDDLLDYSRTQLGVGVRIVRSECCLSEVLSEEIDLLRTALPEATIRFYTSGPVCDSFDASRLREVLANLVSNAYKYGESGSAILVSLARTAEGVELVVRNRGAPLPSASLDELFNPLRRGLQPATSGERTSLGLGLFIVREIVKAHRGEVVGESARGKTTFTVRIPLQA
ncbi:two-component sensor histidine kinase [Lysobacter soli]|uniref:sensor histidine kinase n=1 Tax=Lysobacter soli TaxID=453783 RepID=UPI0012EE738D|nr:HAMP domain-containing sensor histidine kinase [Lysobacter soli]QGW63895.1 two-component sensor histidine kinase [Lysobacter soli]